MNQGFTTERGRATVLNIPNIDTDIVIPQTELTTIERAGLGQGLFARWRYLEARVENPDFVLNWPENRKSRFLVAATNFGCGSSREHAIWALEEFGIRAVVSPKFGEIFTRNCIRNGMLPALISEADYSRLAELSQTRRGGLDLVVDLTEKQIRVDDLVIGFSIDDGDRDRLLKGLDEIQETLAHVADIEAFVAADRVRRPWVHETPWA